MEIILQDVYTTTALKKVIEMGTDLLFAFVRAKEVKTRLAGLRIDSVCSLSPIISVYDIYPFKWGCSVLKGLLTSSLIFKHLCIFDMKLPFASALR